LIFQTVRDRHILHLLHYYSGFAANPSAKIAPSALSVRAFGARSLCVCNSRAFSSRKIVLKHCTSTLSYTIDLCICYIWSLRCPGCNGMQTFALSTSYMPTSTALHARCFGGAFYIAAEPRLSNSFSAVDVRRTIIDFRRLKGRSTSASVVLLGVSVLSCRCAVAQNTVPMQSSAACRCSGWSRCEIRTRHTAAIDVLVKGGVTSSGEPGFGGRGKVAEARDCALSGGARGTLEALMHSA